MSQREAEREILRLNRLRLDDPVPDFWQPTKFFPERRE